MGISALTNASFRMCNKDYGYLVLDFGINEIKLRRFTYHSNIVAYLVLAFITVFHYNLLHRRRRISTEV